MNPADIEWDYLRRHTLRPALSAVTAVALLVAAIWLHGKQLRDYSQYMANHDAVHEDYDSLVRQRRLVENYHRRYQRFRDIGFIGRESRLDWIETLRTTTESLGLPRVGYAIEPQQQAVPPVVSAVADELIDIRVSRMQLDLGLVHEFDLLRFFDALQANAPGLIKVDQCDLTWLAESDVAQSGEANLSATCAVQVLSVITSDVSSEAI